MSYRKLTIPIFVILSVGAVLGFLTGTLTVLQALSGFALAVILSASYQIGLIEKAQENYLDYLNQEEPSGLGNAMSSSEAVEKVEEWAEQRYVDDTGISFRWSKDKMKSDLVHDEDGNPYLFYAFKTYYGENNKGTLVYVEGIQLKDVIDHESIEHPDMEKDPLWFCDMWRNMKDRKEKQILTGNLDYQYAKGSGESGVDLQISPGPNRLQRMNNLDEGGDDEG